MSDTYESDKKMFDRWMETFRTMGEEISDLFGPDCDMARENRARYKDAIQARDEYMMAKWGRK